MMFIRMRKFLTRNIFSYFFRFFPKKNIYFFSSYYGQYNDSPRIISEKLHEINPNARIYWLVDPNKNHNILPGYAKRIPVNSIRAAYFTYCSRYVIDNCQKQLVYPLSKSQTYIQTWHGTPLKKIEFDASNNLSERYNKYSMIDHSSISYLLAGNKYSKKIFEHAFNLDKKYICEFGTPRNDELVNIDQSKVTNIRNMLKIDHNVVVILYAPTFRNDVHKNGLPQLLKLNPESIIKTIEKKYHKKCVFVTRFHPNVQELIDTKALKKLYSKIDFYDVTGKFNMNDILLMSDFLITDYSSSFFDFALTGKPIALFNYDYSDYVKERGTYVDPEQLPIISFKDTKEFMDKLSDLSLADLCDLTETLNQKMGNYEMGKATESVIRLIINQTK